MTPATQAASDYKVMYEDARGWHELLESDFCPSPRRLGEWACVVNDIHRCRISDADDQLAYIITRVVVTDATGAKVCEWPETEGDPL